MRSKLLLASAGLLVSQVALADTPSEVGFSINGRVSTACRAELISGSVQATGDEIDLGGISEFCNNEEGYTVTLTHSPDLAGEALILDNASIVLSETGETTIFQSSQPDVREHRLALVTDQDPSSFNLAVHITPRGQIY